MRRAPKGISTCNPPRKRRGYAAEPARPGLLEGDDARDKRRQPTCPNNGQEHDLSRPHHITSRSWPTRAEEKGGRCGLARSAKCPPLGRIDREASGSV